MKKHTDKWNKYEIGKIEWINKNHSHSCRKYFIDYIKNNNIDNILEIGAGELIEAKSLLGDNPSLRYSVMDISDLFLKYCKDNTSVKAFKGDMTDPPFEDKSFDLVYVSSVLEHSPDIKKTIKAMSRVSKSFYFNMFKWKMKTGNLKSNFKEKKQFFSSYFNIYELLDYIKKYGDIEDLFVCKKDIEERIPFEDYCKTIDNIDVHRTSDYLTIIGSWK